MLAHLNLDRGRFMMALSDAMQQRQATVDRLTSELSTAQIRVEELRDKLDLAKRLQEETKRIASL